MEFAVSLALSAISFSLKAGRRVAVKKLKDSDTSHKTLLQLIVNEIDEVKIQLKKENETDLRASLLNFRAGLEYLDDVLNSEYRDGEEKTAHAELKMDCTETSFVEASLLTETIQHLKKLSKLDEAATKNVLVAGKIFEKARDKAADAFCNKSLQTSEQILAANIGVAAAVLANIENPSIAVPECRAWLKSLHDMEKVKETFKGATKKRDRKYAVSGDDQKNCFLGVCHTNRVVYEITQIAGGRDKMSWIWPCIEFGEERVDPLRDARVVEVLSNLGMKKCCFPWSFGQDLDKEQNLKAAQDIAINKQGHFIVADKGDQNLNIFDEKGNFLRSFHPLSRRLADEDLYGVSTDCEDNLLVLIKIDKYRYEVYVFDEQDNLKNKFRLREGFVRCSPIVNDNNEILVINEEPASQRSLLEWYKDCQYVGSLELEEQTKPSEPTESKGSKEPKDAPEDSKESKLLKEAEYAKGTKRSRKPKEPEDGDTKDQKKSKESKSPTKPKDIAITDDGSVMILNSDGSVDEFKKGTKQRKFKGILSKGLEAISFHSLSKHVLITNKSDGFVQMSVYTQYGLFVDSFHPCEDRHGQEDKEYIAPKIAVTTEGRIAVLTGFVGESKVIVV